MKLYTLRLHPEQDLRQELQRFATLNNIQAGFILTCVGALKCMSIRVAGATIDKQIFKKIEEDFEIISLVGTITATDCHLHVAGSNKDGIATGGHLKEGTLIGVTAEIVIGEDENSIYQRIIDEETGFEELKIIKR